MDEAREAAVRERMKALREGAGLSQREVGRRLGMSGEAYRKKEIGELGVSGQDLARIARLYDTNINEAFPEYEPTEGEVALAEDLGVA